MNNDDDVRDDPEFLAWEQQVRANLIPKLQNSAVTVSLVPEGEVDVKFAVELGLSIMLDKPIIALVLPGVALPAALLRVADRVVLYDPEDMDATMVALQRALSELL